MKLSRASVEALEAMAEGADPPPRQKPAALLPLASEGLAEKSGGPWRITARGRERLERERTEIWPEPPSLPGWSRTIVHGSIRDAVDELMARCPQGEGAQVLVESAVGASPVRYWTSVPFGIEFAEKVAEAMGTRARVAPKPKRRRQDGEAPPGRSGRIEDDPGDAGGGRADREGSGREGGGMR